MLAKRIIPCLDVKGGKVVKGVNFGNLEYAGEPAELAELYEKSGADEIVILDITASGEKRKTMAEVVRKVADRIFVPLTVGGGVKSLDDIRMLLEAGADKVSLNTSALLDPNIITEASEVFGSQCVVVAIDAKWIGNCWNAFAYGGMKDSGKDAVLWAKEAEKLGAGEILLTSIDMDGVKGGFDLELVRTVARGLKIPVIASGGAGCVRDFVEVFDYAMADAALAASVFHYNEIRVDELKQELSKNRIKVRI